MGMTCYFTVYSMIFSMDQHPLKPWSQNWYHPLNQPGISSFIPGVLYHWSQKWPLLKASLGTLAQKAMGPDRSHP